MEERTHNEHCQIAVALKRRAENRDGWRRFWAGLRAEDRQLLKEIVNQFDN